MSYWRTRAQEAIDLADKTVPAGASLKERMRIIDAAFPFYDRKGWPYAKWLQARRQYLARHGGEVKPKHLPLSPLERAKARALGLTGKKEMKTDEG